MSTERESICIVGYNLSNEEVLNIIKKGEYLNPEFVVDWSGFHAYLAEALMESLNTDLKVKNVFNENYHKENVIGIEIKSDLSVEEATKAMQEATDFLEKEFKQFDLNKPKVFFEIFSY